MTEETELIIQIWDRIENYIPNDTDKLGAAHQLLEVFDEMGHSHAVTELAENCNGLDASLSSAAASYGDEDDDY